MRYQEYVYRHQRRCTRLDWFWHRSSRTWSSWQVARQDAHGRVLRRWVRLYGLNTGIWARWVLQMAKAPADHR